MKALKAGATPASIMAGLKCYNFSTDEQFIPHAATWLNGESWRSFEAKSLYAHVAAPATVKSANSYGQTEVDFTEFLT
jgi:hypothetical protein